MKAKRIIHLSIRTGRPAIVIQRVTHERISRRDYSATYNSFVRLIRVVMQHPLFGFTENGSDQWVSIER